MIFFFVVVIYNKKCCESQSCRALLKRKKDDERVLIIDNSDKICQENKETCENLNWKYINMGGNKGLTKAYNRAIRYLKDYSEDMIIWLDDDTYITDEYINELKEKTRKNKNIDIFMPVIKDSNDKIISPSIYTKIKIINIKNKTEIVRINKKNILGINTCLAVRISLYQDYLYNENQFLDLVDNQFFYDMRQRKVEFQIIPVEIKQSFFSTEKQTYESKIKRTKIEVHDYKIYVSNKSVIEKVMYLMRTLFWGIRGSIKYHNLKFLYEVIKSI